MTHCSFNFTVYPKKYAHGFCFAVLCCGYTSTDFPISIRLTSLALWQSNDCPSASKSTLMNMNKYFMWIHYKRLHNHNKAKHNKTVCIFLGIYCISLPQWVTITRHWWNVEAMVVWCERSAMWFKYIIDRPLTSNNDEDHLEHDPLRHGTDLPAGCSSNDKRDWLQCLLFRFTTMFPLARTPYINSWVITINCRMYSNISQILLQYKTWQY